jgi:hypothetical protein
MGSLRLPSARQLGAGVLAALWLSPAAAFAQDPPTAEIFEAPAHLAYVDGTATLDRDGQAQQATSGMPLVTGDRVRTAAGRAEILFPDGSALDVDEYSSLDVLSPTLLRLTSGRVLLTVAGSSDPDAATRYQIDTPAASAFSDGPGEYRIAIFNGSSTPETELAVLRGYAAFSTDIASVSLGAGERSLARASTSPSAPLRFNSARFDAFEQWAAARRDERTGTVSAQYLPSDLQMYSGTFDRYGSWDYEAQYGQVWYPTVAPDWRPYYYGYWSPIRSYGWTWIGFDRWGWPTHHYGRWGHARNRWFWIPHRRWAPAWVSWASAPGYVSWCPLGFDNRPVFSLSVSIGRTWNAWTVLPRHHFGGYNYVHRYALPPRQIVTTTPFVVQASAPVAPPRAVPRSAGRTVAVPRDGGGALASRPAPVASPRSAVLSRQAGAGGQTAVSPSGRTAVRRSGIAAAIPTTPPDGRTASTPAQRAPSAAVRRGAAPAARSAAPPSNGANTAAANGAGARQARPRTDRGLSAPIPSASAPDRLPRARVAPPQYRSAPGNNAGSSVPQAERPSRGAPQAVPRSAPPSAVGARPRQAQPQAPPDAGAPSRGPSRGPSARVAPSEPRQAAPSESAPAARAPSAVPRGAARAPAPARGEPSRSAPARSAPSEGSARSAPSEGSARSAPSGGARQQPAARSRRP